jgi:endonuclease VIII
VPEGDTVWTTARLLDKALTGHEVTRSEFRVPKLAVADITGWHVVEWLSRGKHLLLRLRQPSGAAWTLHSHLRMDGAWRVYPKDARWRGGPSHAIRAIVGTAGAVAVGYRVHELDLVPTNEENRLVGHLGPDLLGPDWDPAVAVERLRTRPDRAIADALIDQRNLAGIGNLFKAETLFLRGVNPWCRVSEVDELEAMVSLAQRLLAANRGRWTQSTTGSLRRGEECWVFERAGAPCRRCGTTIRRATGRQRAEPGEARGQAAGRAEMAGDYDRITYWCPHCQPGSAPPGTTRPTLAHD